MDKFVNEFVTKHSMRDDTDNFTDGIKDAYYNGARLNKSAVSYDRENDIEYNIKEYTKPIPKTTNGVTMFANKQGNDGTIQ